jgi:hypothetical protein
MLGEELQEISSLATPSGIGAFRVIGGGNTSARAQGDETNFPETDVCRAPTVEGGSVLRLRVSHLLHFEARCPQRKFSTITNS